MVPRERFREVVNAYFGGRLSAGRHHPGEKACALEAVAVARGKAWTDDPGDVEMPDLRPLNDGPWPSDDARTAALVPVVEALWDWSEWSDTMQQAWHEAVVHRTVFGILADLLRAFGLAGPACACEDVGTFCDARLAARAAARALLEPGSPPARLALESALAAERAASPWGESIQAAYAALFAALALDRLGRHDAAEATLQRACRIWIEAARDLGRGGT